MKITKTTMIKIVVILIVFAIAFLTYVPPYAEFMPKGKRFPNITFPLLPPLLAIALCIITGEVLPSLFLGIWIGALMIMAYNPIDATVQTISWYVGNAADSWNATILLFDFIIGAWIGILYTSGALFSVAEVLSKRVKTAKGASVASSALGLIVFFDDYTNTVVVGNAMKPLTDKLRVSREMLSYIVDSTAAPVAGLFLVSTWIGYEVSQIQWALSSLQEDVERGVLTTAPGISSYMMWLNSVPYHFYSILAIILVFLIAYTRKHFGPMLNAEYRAIREGKVLRDGATPLMPTEEVLGGEELGKKRVTWHLFVVSTVVLIFVAILGMWITGSAYYIIGPGSGAERDRYIVLREFWKVSLIDSLYSETVDAALALLWASVAAYLISLIWILVTRVTSLKKAMRATIKGMYLMVYANAILLNAWTIKDVVDALGTADYVVEGAKVLGISPWMVPLIMYSVSMFISFNTGTSWGTFGIMMPIAVPMAWKLALMAYPDNISIAYIITFASIGAVFGGGIFGDHCSPISDTTIMSSMFSGSDHIDHVKTQLPYALLAGLIGILLYALFALGLTSPIILLIIGIVLLIILHRVISNYYARRMNLPVPVPDYNM
ncbi:MAG: Na+/H+ antiporter NhaC family protein [Desulfurococcaceae archaeon]